MSAESGARLVLAFDFGERRIGVAAGNRLTATASPIAVITCRHGEPHWPDVDRCMKEWAPAALLVGNPPTGSEALRTKLQNFVQALENRYKLPVCLVDESLTSHAAEMQLAALRRDGIRTRRVKRGEVDKLAACLIAQRWLDESEPDRDA